MDSGTAITVAGYPYDRVQGLAVEGCDIRFERSSIGEMNTHVFDGPGTREVSEIGLLPYLIAYANSGFRDYVLIPVFPLRTFRHKSIFVRTDRGIERPEDLRGRRVGTPGYSMTSLTWIRGMLQHQYGVSPDEIEWVLSTGDSSVGVAGTRSAHEQLIPDGVEVSYGTPGKDESELLVDGEVDALFHGVEPQAFVEGNPLVGRLFADSRETERQYFAETGIYPVAHGIAIRADMIADAPWLPEAVFRGYATAKQRALGRLRAMGWAMISLPWLGQEEEATREVMGDNFWPYGIEQNRRTLDALLQYAYEQGSLARELAADEIFHESTVALSDSPPGSA